MPKAIATLGLIVVLAWIYQSFVQNQKEIAPRSPLRSGAAAGSGASQRGSEKGSTPSLEKAKSAPSQGIPSLSERGKVLPPPSPPATERLRAGDKDDQRHLPAADQPGVKAMAYDLKSFGIDTVLALGAEQRLRFLDRNQLKEPGRYMQYRFLPDFSLVSQALRGSFRGSFESIDGKRWTLILSIDGELEAERFNGSLGIELLNANGETVARSTTDGPLDEHVRVIEEGERPSLLITPRLGPENAHIYQIFVGEENRSLIAGNYYHRKDDGEFELSGPFVLKRSGSSPDKLSTP